jgi:hypothetical protein
MPHPSFNNSILKGVGSTITGRKLRFWPMRIGKSRMKPLVFVWFDIEEGDDFNASCEITKHDFTEGTLFVSVKW